MVATCRASSAAGLAGRPLVRPHPAVPITPHESSESAIDENGQNSSRSIQSGGKHRTVHGERRVVAPRAAACLACAALILAGRATGATLLAGAALRLPGRARGAGLLPSRRLVLPGGTVRAAAGRTGRAGGTRRRRTGARTPAVSCPAAIGTGVALVDPAGCHPLGEEVAVVAGVRHEDNAVKP